LIRPGIQLKPIEGYAAAADRNFGEVWTHFRVEAVSIHRQVRASLPSANPAGLNAYVVLVE